MDLFVGLVILWGVALVILLFVLLISIFSLNGSVSKMNETVKRLANELESGKHQSPPSEAQTTSIAPAAPQDAPQAEVPAFQETPAPITQPEASDEPAAESPDAPVVTTPETIAQPSPEPPPAEPLPTEPPAPPEVIIPPEPTVLELRLKMLKNWLLYGRREGVGEGESAEKLLATTWLLRCGIIVILFTSAFLLKLSIDRGLLAPSGRVALSYLAGAGLLLAGLSRRMRQRYWSLGQALCGISLGVFYFSSFAMTSMYHLVKATIGGGVMCLTTLTAGFLADRLNSLSVAMVAMLGGYATPLLLNTGAKNFPGLAAYLLLLGIGVLWLACRRNWSQLHWLAMLFTYGIFALAAKAHYTTGDYLVVQTSLILFFVLFSTTVFIHNVRKSEPATALEIFGLLGNSMLFFGMSWWAINSINDGERLFFAPLTIGLAAYYLLHAVILGRRRNDSLRGLVLSFCALSGFYLALTFPVVLSGEWLAAAWAMQAFMMLWLGYRMDSRLLKNCAWILYAMTLGRLALYEFHHYDNLTAIQDGSFWSGIISRIIQYMLPVGSLAAAAHLTMKVDACQTTEALAALPADKNETMPSDTRARGGVLTGLLLGLAFIVLFLFLRLEIGVDLWGHSTYRLTGINLVWLGGCLAALTLLKKGLPGWWRTFLAILLGGTILRLFIDFFDDSYWNWGTPLSEWTYCLGSLCNTAVLVLGLMLCGRLMPDGKFERLMGLVCRITWPILLFIHSTREWSLIIKYKLPGLTGGGVSVLWAIFAFVLVFRGLTKTAKSLRYLGLALFAVVVCKVFLFDMSHLEAIYRVLAFFAFGVLLMGAAFIYLKFWRNSSWNVKEEK